MSSIELGISQGRRGFWQQSSERLRAPWRRGIWSRVEVAAVLRLVGPNCSEPSARVETPVGCRRQCTRKLWTMRLASWS